MKRKARSTLRTRLPGAFEWFCLAAGVALILRYLWLLDDAFVYYRYVDNLLFLKRGLVFNAGEYVEGFSSPLWAILLIVLRSTTLDYWFLTKGLAVVTFLATWAMLVSFNRRMSPAGSPPVNFPLVFVSFAYGPLCYFSSGLEFPLVQASAVVYAMLALSPGSRPLQAVVAFTPLVRHELALPFVLFTLWCAWRTRRIPWIMLGTATVVVGAWLAFRVFYYADLLPNTYYLKNDVNISQGLVYVRQNLVTYAGPFAVALLTGWLAARAARRRRPTFEGLLAPHRTERLVLLAGALSITAYVIKIGGDPDHYRFVAFPFALLACSLAGLPEAVVSSVRVSRRGPLSVALAVGLAALTFVAVPPQLEGHPVFGNERHRRVEKIGDASWHRHHPHLSFDPHRSREDRTRRERYYKRLRERSHSPRYRICTLCIPAYQDMSSRFVHEFGLTDAILARTDARADRAGHKYSLKSRAKELAELLVAAERVDEGVFRRAVERGTAPEWIREGLPAIQIVARKVYNRHDWKENLRLAFTFPPRIRVPELRDDPTAVP